MTKTTGYRLVLRQISDNRRVTVLKTEGLGRRSQGSLIYKVDLWHLRHLPDAVEVQLKGALYKLEGNKKRRILLSEIQDLGLWVDPDV